MSNNANIGENIRIFLEKKFGKGYGLLKVYSEKLDMHPSSLDQYLKNKRKPGADILAKLAKLGADINYILTGEHYVDADIQRQLEELRADFEGRITALEAENYRYIKKLEQRDAHIEALETELKALSVQYSRVAEANSKFGRNKIK